MKLLIDECLSPRLVERARPRGHGESAHVVWRGWAGKKDWELIRHVLDEDWTFVTRNAVDFRGPAADPGGKGLYAKADIHAGLICLIGSVDMDLALQLELFEHALDEVGEDGLVNQVLEIFLDEHGYINIRRYILPPQGKAAEREWFNGPDHTPPTWRAPRPGGRRHQLPPTPAAG